jgi:hypothetical protein
LNELRRQFAEIGALRFRSILRPDQVTRAAALFGKEGRPGRRLGHADLASIADLLRNEGPVGGTAALLLGRQSTPVRALLLDKSERANWRLGWHQDRTIAVRERIEVDGFGPWSVKAGQLHVQPPIDVTARMVTLRVHVDPVNQNNAPLQVLPGSHAAGRLLDSELCELASESEPLTCLAESGDVWAYATPIVHASAEQKVPGRRRVLQLDYSADELPGGLAWAELI